jgi:protein TonB
LLSASLPVDGYHGALRRRTRREQGDAMANSLLVSEAAAKRSALLAVIGLHVALIALLATGTAQRLVTAVSEPLKVALLEPPKQRPPPEPIPLPQAPPLEPPPPVFVPPPEVRIARPKPAQPIVQSTPKPASPAPPVAPPAMQPPAPKTNAGAVGPPRDLKPARDLTRPAKIVVAQCDQPSYPAAARREEATGTSRIRFEVDATGHVIRAEILQRSGRSRAHRQLDQAAVDALSRCEFTPGRDKLGHPTGGYASVEYVWRLE